MHRYHDRHGGGFGHMINMQRGRARRGDVRASIITLLGEDRMHGYQIIQEISERTSGAWNPSPGAIYPALRALEDEGVISSENVEGKRVFALTDAGRKHAELLPSEGPWAAMSSESDPSRNLRGAFHSLMSAAAQIGRTGTPDEIERTTEILNNARKDIYRMLAGE